MPAGLKMLYAILYFIGEGDTWSKLGGGAEDTEIPFVKFVILSSMLTPILLNVLLP
jgi:hypothetical protein